MPKKNKKIGLVLGGGGARGAAHIGVLTVLHREGFEFDRIVGTSSGAIVGAMYAATKDPEWIAERFRKFIKSDAFKKTRVTSVRSDRNPDSVFGQMSRFVHNQFVIAMAINRESIIEKNLLVDAIRFLLPVDEFKDLKIPLATVCTDLNSGKTIVREEGDLVEAVVQSSSIPGFVEPTIIGDQRLVDGGVTAPFPSSIIKGKVDFILGVNISRGYPKPLKKANILEIITRTELITSMKLTEAMTDQADFVIRPNTMGLHWSEFNKIDDLISNGQQAAESALSELYEKLDKRLTFRQRIAQWISVN